MNEKKINVKNFSKKIFEFENKGYTTMIVSENKRVIGVIAVADALKEDSVEAIKELNKSGYKTIMITGDNERTAKAIADTVGISEVVANVLPEEKSKITKKMKEFGRVAFVGDGINDAPALAQADLGVAIGAGTNVAIESAGIILVKNDPRDIVKIINLSKATYSRMIQNLFWATGYNVIALPLAAGVLVSKGILLQPALAAVFMSLSTVIVAVNAVLLRKQKI